MASVKPPKKTETIEVRLSHEAKDAFMAQCRREQRTASEAVRLFIDAQIAPTPTTRLRPVPHWRVIAAGLAGLALGVGAAAPSFARSAPGTQAAFEQLDRNQDGVLSYQEFHAR
jgi:hypothetical protein